MSRKVFSRNILKFIIPLFVMTTFVFVNNNPPVVTSAWSGTQTSNVGNYYSTVTGSETGSALKSKLKTIISSPTPNTNYDWPRYRAADEAEGDSNSVLLIYTRTNSPKTNSGGNTTNWNREHTFPQSKIGSPADQDNHHIFADDNKTNGARGNKRYGVVTETSGNRVKDMYGNLTDNYTTNDYFMPTTAARGEVARATMYLSTLYDYSVTDNFQAVELMLSWHLENPVTNREIYRNNTVHSLQNNRNPYIDHPEYACSVWGDTNSSTQSLCGSSSTVNVTSVTVTPKTQTLDLQGTTTLQMSATVLPSNATNKALTWTSSNNSVATVSSSGQVTAKAVGTTTITATSAQNTAIKDTATITVTNNVATFGTLASIAIKTPANKLSYYVGNTFSSAGLVLTASDNSNPVVTKDVTSGFTTNFDGVSFNSSHLGSKTVVVSYKEGSVTKTVNYNITINEASTEKTYAKITSTAQLQIGANYLISGTSGSQTYVMSTTQNGNNRGSQTVTLSNGKIVESITMQRIELTSGTKSNTFGFKAVNGGSQGYLYAASSESNHLRTQSTLDDNASWKITFSGTTLSATAQGTNTRNTLKLNVSTSPPIFSAYGTGQVDIDMWLEETPIIIEPSVTITSGVSQVVARNTLQLAATTAEAGSAVVNWSVNDSSVATINSTSGFLTAIKAGTVIVTASISVGGNTYTDTLQVIVSANPYDHDGTEADPFSVKDALLKASETGTTATSVEYYIKGIISEITEVNTAGFGNATFLIEDSLGDNVSFMAYRVKWGASGVNFTTETAQNIVVGYEVLLLGRIINYNNTTPEVVQNSKVIAVDKTPAIYAETKAFSDWMMNSLRNSEECEDKFLDASTIWEGLSQEAKDMFVSHADFVSAQARLLNWAIANGLSSLDELDNKGSGIKSDTTPTSNMDSLTATIIIGVIGLTTLVGYYLLKKRQTQN